jgi:uncharacterized Zn-finger protein
MQKQAINKDRQVEVTAEDLPLHCPMPSMLLWNSHPRVYLPIESTSAKQCALLAGTRYSQRAVQWLGIINISLMIAFPMRKLPSEIF